MTDMERALLDAMEREQAAESRAKAAEEEYERARLMCHENAKTALNAIGERDAALAARQRKDEALRRVSALAAVLRAKRGRNEEIDAIGSYLRGALAAPDAGACERCRHFLATDDDVCTLRCRPTARDSTCPDFAAPDAGAKDTDHE
jgi:hypothetical protein